MEKREKHLVMNASTQPVQAQYDGAHYTFRPGETKEISNFYTAKHLSERWSNYGLVSLDYTGKDRSLYADFEDYCLAKQKEGLDSAIENVELTLINFDVYDDSCGEKRSPVRSRFKKKKEEWVKILSDMKAQRDKLDNVDLTAIKTANLNAEAERLKAQLEEANKKLASLGSQNIRGVSDNNATKSDRRLSDRDARS